VFAYKHALALAHASGGGKCKRRVPYPECNGGRRRRSAQAQRGRLGWPGISDREFFSAELDGWNNALKATPRYWELALTLTSEIRWEEPFAGANYLLSQLRQLTRAFPQYPKDSFHRFLFSEAISQLSLFLVRIIEQTFDLGERDREGLIRKGLTYGNLDPKYAERILESAYNLSRQSVLHYTNQTVDLDRQVFSMPEPPGTDQLFAFLEVLLKGYPASLIFPQVTDYFLQERFLKKKDMRRLLRRMFPQVTLGASISLAEKFLKALVSIGACPPYIEEIFAKPEPDQAPAEVKVENATASLLETSQTSNVSPNIDKSVQDANPVASDNVLASQEATLQGAEQPMLDLSPKEDQLTSPDGEKFTVLQDEVPGEKPV
jgi:hypothetical protein